MRTDSEVLEKFNELYNRYLEQRKDKYLSRIPINCEWNYQMRVKGKGKIGFCQNPDIIEKNGDSKLFVCNGPEKAEKCRCFKCKHTADSVCEDFINVIQSPSRCGSEYPKLGVIIWYLQTVQIPGCNISRKGGILNFFKRLIEGNRK